MTKEHWDQECDDPLSDLGREKVKQQVFDNFKKTNKSTSIQIQDLNFKESDYKYWSSVRDKPHSLSPPPLPPKPVALKKEINLISFD
jgi:hypothetical protein